MKISRVGLSAFAFTWLLGSPVSAAPPTANLNPMTIEDCGVIAPGPDGKVQFIPLPSLSILSLGDDSTFSLPADAPSEVQVVQCERGALVPRRNDYKVIDAGFPFIISSGNRIGALEIVDGRLQFNMIQGDISETEIPLVQAFLDAAQTASDSKR